MSRPSSIDYAPLEVLEKPLNRKNWFKVPGSELWRKRCTNCFEILPLHRFCKNVNTTDGLHYRCSTCAGTMYRKTTASYKKAQEAKALKMEVIKEQQLKEFIERKEKEPA